MVMIAVLAELATSLSAAIHWSAREDGGAESSSCGSDSQRIGREAGYPRSKPLRGAALSGIRDVTRGPGCRPRTIWAAEYGQLKTRPDGNAALR